MPTFSYKAVTKQGKKVKGFLEADSERLAIFSLKSQDLIPLEINLTTKKIHKKDTEHLSLWDKFLGFLGTLQSIEIGKKNVSVVTIAAVIRQLATLFKAGLPLDKALSYLCMQSENPKMKECLAQMRDKICTGSSLADSMAEFPLFFSQTLITMVRAGEESGSLEFVIERYADHIEQQVALKRKMQSALAYPIFMFVIGVLIIVFLLTYVVPQVTQIFTDMGKELPLATQILLAVSSFVRSSWAILFICFVGICILFKQLRKTEKGKRFWHNFLFRMPLISPVYRLIVVGQLTRTLGMLVNNGVPLLKALKIVQSIVDNVIIHELIQKMINGVQEGKELSSFMGETKVFPSLAQNMVSAGEKSGTLSAMLLWVADDCDANLTSKVQVLTSLLEPIMILILGSFVGFVVIAIMLPIFEMSSLAG